MKRFSILTLFSLYAAVSFAQKDLKLDVIDSLIADERYEAARELINSQRRSTDHHNNGLLASRMASILILEGDLDGAELELRPFLNSSDHYIEAVTKTRLGFLYLNKARNDLALENLQKAWELFRQSSLEESPEAATCLSYLSLVYLSSGKTNQALENALITLQLHEKLYGVNTEETAAAYNDLGLVYSTINADQALEYYEKAQAIYEKIHGKEHRKIAIASINIGIMYRQLKLYGDAVNNFESAEAIWKKIYPNGHPNQALALMNLGITYHTMGDRNAALSYYEKALAIYRKSYGRKHSDIANVLNQMGVLRISQNKYEEALSSYQQALIANSPSFEDTIILHNPRAREYYNGKVLLFSLRLKAEALEALHFGKTLRFRELEQGIACLQSCDTLIDDLRYHSQDENDKLDLGNEAAEVYEDGVRIAYSMSQMSFHSKPYKELAFYFAEKSKSAVLQASIADAEAKSFAGIPDELLDREKNLKAINALLNQKLSLKPPPEEERQIRQSLYASNREYEQFIHQLERDFPDYYNLKFSQATPSVATLQKTLSDDHAIVSYFVAERSRALYTFIITDRRFKIIYSTLPAEIDNIVKGFNNSIFYTVPGGYRTTVNILSPILLRGLPNTKSLTIIPAGRFSTMPFEALPLSRIREDFQFSDVRFLIKTHDINYSFSAGLLLHEKKRNPATGSNRSILLCAPVTFPDNYELSDLPGTEAEVTRIAKLFGQNAEIHKGEDASEALVKSGSLANYNIIHFATHGVVNEEYPELSRIFLQPSGNEDGYLFSGEVFNLRMNADLAALSACQTGLGKLSKGEGVIGLSRALLYAGASTIMVSYWSVADESTSELMTEFYRNLLSGPGHGFSHALQQAKQSLIAGQTYAAPYYWAPFVLIGN